MLLEFHSKHKEITLVVLIGLIIFSALNIMMLFYHYDEWIKLKVGFYSTFANRFEISGFDPYTYIILSTWRPLYVLERHPLLAIMLWPLSKFNTMLMEVTGINCAIYIVAVIWTMLSTCSWTLLYKIERSLIGLTCWESMLLTFFFFGFSHVLLTTFTEDHMCISLVLLLLTIYIAGKSIQRGTPMRNWQILVLSFLSTGISSTNFIKIGIADFFTQPKDIKRFIKHSAIYIMPLVLLGGLYILQSETTQKNELESSTRANLSHAAKDSVYAKHLSEQTRNWKKNREDQIIKLGIFQNTEYRIDRINSLVENIFGEGIILHSDYSLKDVGRGNRPVLVRYNHWWQYVVESSIVFLFVLGSWSGRRNRIMWIALSMFIFDMFLHVVLNFASADVYIMTAHWAFVIPIAIGCYIKSAPSYCIKALTLLIIGIITIVLYLENIPIIVRTIIC